MGESPNPSLRASLVFERQAPSSDWRLTRKSRPCSRPARARARRVGSGRGQPADSPKTNSSNAIRFMGSSFDGTGRSPVDKEVIEVGQEAPQGGRVLGAAPGLGAEAPLPAASQHDVAVALQQLALMLTNGVPLFRPWRFWLSSPENERIRNAFDQIMSVSPFTGAPYRVPCPAFPELFPRDVLLMVKAGEESGDIVKRLHRARSCWSDDNDLISSVKFGPDEPSDQGPRPARIMFLLVKLVLPKFMDMYAV